jgi:uncharacterized protein YjbI with pentapeptide repeats
MPTARKMALKPLNYQDPLYQLLRDGNIKEFNRRKAQGERCDLTCCELRNLALRGLDASGLDFSNSYFRAADLRGIDFSTARLEGASINNAKISGPISARTPRRRNHAFRDLRYAPALPKVSPRSATASRPTEAPYC